MISKFSSDSNNFIVNCILLLSITFFSCTETEPIYHENPISNPTFTFMQEQNAVYFSAKFKTEYREGELDSTFVRWYGPDITGSFDVIVLNDDGANGDIISGDNIFSRKIQNTSLSRNPITNSDTSFLYADFTAVYGGSNFVGLLDSAKIGNLIPEIIEIFADTLINRPEGRNINLIKVKAMVFDGDGLETIKWVGFTSFSLRDNEMMNNGNMIYLYDDGNTEILYPPDFTSGDTLEGDGLYTFKIPIYGDGFGTEPLDDTTRTGSFRWRFTAQDIANDYSQTVDHVIVIQ